MKKIIFTTLFVIISLNAFAQLGWQWGVTNYIAGHQPGAEGWIDAYLIALDKSDNVYITASVANATYATVYGTDTVPNTGHYYQIVIVKTDSSGNYLWANGTQNTFAYPLAIVTDNSSSSEAGADLYLLGFYDSSICTIGSFNLSNPMEHTMYFLAKFSSSGTVLWAENVAPAGVPFGDAAPGAMGIDSAGNIYVTGNFSLPSITIGATTLTNTNILDSTSDIFIAKYNSSGTPVWAKSFGSMSYDDPSALAVDQGGNAYLTGLYGSSPFTIGTTALSDSARFLAKFDNNGNLLWGENINASLDPAAITTDVSGNIYTSGNVSGTPGSITILNADTLTNTGYTNAFIAKYDPSGNIQWGKIATSPGGNHGFDISVDLDNHLWVTGSMGDTLNISGNTFAEPTGSFDPSFIAEYNTSGTYLTCLTLPSGGDDASDIIVDNRGNFYDCGDYSYISMVIGPDSLPLSDADTQAEALYIAKYKYDTAVYLAVKPVNTPAPDIDLFPNPAKNECTIQTSATFPPGSKAELYDITGRLVNTYYLSSNSTAISLSGISPGVYYCQVSTGNSDMVVKKLVVMR